METNFEIIDITNKSTHVVRAMKKSSKYKSIKIYKVGECEVIRTLHENNQYHTSVSVEDRQATMDELIFIIENVVKKDVSDVKIYANPDSDVIHIMETSRMIN